MVSKQMKNPSLHIKLQEAMAKPYFAGVREAAISNKFISRLKAEAPDPYQRSSAAVKSLRRARYETDSLGYAPVGSSAQ